MNILVTGAAGFIGSHLAERLAGLGHHVRSVDCFTDYYSSALKRLNAAAVEDKGGEFLALDLADDDLHAALEDVHVIYHLAAQPGLSATTTFDTYMRNNITATERLLEAVASSSALRLLVNISTSSVYGSDATGDETTEPKPTSHYGVTKLAAEQLVLARARNANLPACSLRLFSVYGPRERPEKLYPQLIRCMLEDKPFALFEGSEHHLRSFTYVADVVDGMVAVLDNIERCRGEILNIGTDTAIHTGEGMRILEEITGKRIEVTRRPKRAGDQLKTHADIAKARRLLNYNPTTTVAEGLQREFDWYRQQVFGKVNLPPV